MNLRKKKKIRSLFSLDIIKQNPIHIWIEPTNRCNVRCIHCAHHYHNFGEDMKDEIYQKIIQSLINDVKEVDLIGYGEPFLTKSFFSFFDRCISSGIKTNATTNGLLLTEEYIKKIIYNNTELTISIDGACKETYEFIRANSKWERLIDVLENIKKITDEAGKRKKFNLKFNFVPMKANIKELPDVVLLAAKYGADEIFIIPLGGSENFEKIKNQSLEDSPELISKYFLKALKLGAKHKINIAVPQAYLNTIINKSECSNFLINKLFRIKKILEIIFIYIHKKSFLKRLMRKIKLISYKGSPFGKGFCSMPWLDTYFAANGNVYQCCILGYLIGNICEQSWDEIRNNTLYRNLRRTIHGWNPTSICRYCGFPVGINCGEEKRYQKFFSKYEPLEIPLDSEQVIFKEGFYELEHTADGRPSHRWMGKTGLLDIKLFPKAKFVKFIINPLSPLSKLNPGKCTINNSRIEFFDNSCQEIIFPVPNNSKNIIQMKFEMEFTSLVPPDTRPLSIPFVKIFLLFQSK